MSLIDEKNKLVNRLLELGIPFEDSNFCYGIIFYPNIKTFINEVKEMRKNVMIDDYSLINNSCMFEFEEFGDLCQIAMYGMTNTPLPVYVTIDEAIEYIRSHLFRIFIKELAE